MCTATRHTTPARPDARQTPGRATALFGCQGSAAGYSARPGSSGNTRSRNAGEHHHSGRRRQLVGVPHGEAHRRKFPIKMARSASSSARVSPAARIGHERDEAIPAAAGTRVGRRAGPLEHPHQDPDDAQASAVNRIAIYQTHIPLTPLFHWCFWRLSPARNAGYGDLAGCKWPGRLSLL